MRNPRLVNVYTYETQSEIQYSKYSGFMQPCSGLESTWVSLANCHHRVMLRLAQGTEAHLLGCKKHKVLKSFTCLGVISIVDMNDKNAPIIQCPCLEHRTLSPHEWELTLLTCMWMRGNLSKGAGSLLNTCSIIAGLQHTDILFASRSLSRVLEATYKLDRKSFDVIWWHAQGRAIGLLQLPSLSLLTFSAYITKDSK